MEKINVLIFPAGEINSVELHDALSTCVNIDVYGASSIERHGKYIFKNYIGDIPKITENNFLSEFNKLLKQYNISVIFPTHDTVSLFLIENQEKINAKIIGGDIMTSEICRYKHKTYTHFANEDFAPVIYRKITDVKLFPVFIKPNSGQGAVDTRLAHSVHELKNIDFEQYVVSEYLPGGELTVDCFTDKNEILKYVSPRTRDRIMAGVSVAGKTVEVTTEILNIATKINSKLNFKGLWYFQIKQNKDCKYKLLEISTRCAGSMCLTRAKSVNLPLLSVYAAMGYEIEVLENNYNVTMDRILISRYEIDYEYDTVYFDFDDTLIVNDKVNLTAIRFLYQCVNLKKKIVLLTKHEKTLYSSLDKYSINPKLFTDIIHIDINCNKTDFIISDKAIFIDNAFVERKKVFEKYHIPVFDVDGIEVLLDWRY
jgi:predicted ATP-grasp superfamily ATP-dependent carboligase